MNDSRIVDGIWVNPELPENFDNTPNDARPESHQQWWYIPYILQSKDNSCTVRCLDGGAWDRSTWKGQFSTLDQAIEYVKKMTNREEDQAD